MYETDLSCIIGTQENILWQGKPDKKCFILESIFNPLLPFALIWAVFDSFFIGVSAMSGDKTALMFVIPFMLFHLMPVWIYLGGVILSFRKYHNTEYIITDRGIYVSGGTFAYTYEMKPFTDLSHISVHRGIFDQWLGVGDVVTTCSHNSYSGNRAHSHGSQGLSICDIPDYQRVCALIKDLQTDIYADTMYPNDLRPRTNHGYRTTYDREDTFR